MSKPTNEKRKKSLTNEEQKIVVMEVVVMSKKRTLAQAAIARFLNHCESNGWSIVALLYIYNLNNSLENRKTEEEFKNMLNEGDMSLEDFIILFHAAMGVIEG